MQSRTFKNWSHPHAWKLFCPLLDALYFLIYIHRYICIYTYMYIVCQLKQELQSDVRTPQMEDEPPTGDDNDKEELESDDGPNWTPENLDEAYQKLGEDTTNNSQTTKPKYTH